jgi:hypothetical protein
VVTAGGWEQSQPPNFFLMPIPFRPPHGLQIHRPLQPLRGLQTSPAPAAAASKYLARYFTGEEAGSDAAGR